MMTREDVFNHFSVSRETRERISLFIEDLQKWSRVYNLMGPQEMERIWEKHVFGALEMAEFLKSYSFPIVDIGTGSGFPGMILASVFPERDIYFVDPNQKKMTVLQEISYKISQHVHVSLTRIENFRAQQSELFDSPLLLTSRAFATLEIILKGVMPVSRETMMILPKSEIQVEPEIQKALKKWDFKWEIQRSETGPDQVLLIIKDISEKKHG